MKGLTRLEVDLLLDAAEANDSPPRVLPSPQMSEACFQLRHRRLLIFVTDADGWTRGVITQLGRLALSIALSEPSFITP